jgi:tetratricopeptide (TPR) repeat protein
VASSPAASQAGEDRLSAIAAAAVEVLRTRDYHAARTEDIAAAVRMDADKDGRSRRGRRSAVWVYSEVKSRRVLVALAAFHAWKAHQARLTGPAGRPPPASLAEAQERLAEALTEIVRFHRAQRMLMTQVAYGIGDVGTSEKRASSATTAPQWHSGPFGRVAAEGYRFRIGAFADFLAEHLRAAAQAVMDPPEEEIQHSAQSLSDLAFRACIGDLEGPIDRIGSGLAAYWYERDLLRLAGPWVRELDAAERSLAATRQRGTDPRAEAYAHMVVIRVLLEAGTLHARSADEGARLVDHLRSLSGWEGSETSTDRRALSDAAARQGLSLVCYGRLAAAREAFTLSREAAEDPSLVARADQNLADVALQAGDVSSALVLAADVRDRRDRLAAQAADEPAHRAACRRLSLTDELLARATIRSGQVVRGVTLATEILATRTAAPDDFGTNAVANAQVLVADALVSAGHPGEAYEAARKAFRQLHTTSMPGSDRIQRAQVLLARIARAEGRPQHAIELLRDAPALSAWFADRVSARLSYAARVLLAAALGESGGLAESGERLEQLSASPLPGAVAGETDPLSVLTKIELASSLLKLGEPDRAAALLRPLVPVRPKGDATPLQGQTMLVSARCAMVRGDVEAAERAYEAVVRCAVPGEGSGMDPGHPVAAAARLSLAASRADRGDLDSAAGLLAPVLDMTVLAHGRPAFGADHPLLRDAVVLADRIGQPHSWGSLPPLPER